MITLPGQLAIKTIHGRNGDFNVGRLATSIGEFVIKNAELDQYREGKYEGDFVITEIRPSTYNTSGRMVIEIRAHLGGMTLSNIDHLSRDEANRLSPQEVDATLFGALWPLGEIVKLDATVDRRLLRQQRDRLGALGYEFA
ncbi:DUF3275 family protein, partial [Alkalimonas collagenimarina]